MYNQIRHHHWTSFPIWVVLDRPYKMKLRRRMNGVITMNIAKLIDNIGFQIQGQKTLFTMHKRKEAAPICHNDTGIHTYWLSYMYDLYSFFWIEEKYKSISFDAGDTLHFKQKSTWISEICYSIICCINPQFVISGNKLPLIFWEIYILCIMKLFIEKVKGIEGKCDRWDFHFLELYLLLHFFLVNSVLFALSINDIEQNHITALIKITLEMEYRIGWLGYLQEKKD